MGPANENSAENFLAKGWRPREVDMQRPSPARMYDYYLDGANNFPFDRKAADEALAILPEIRTFARQNRAFLRRAVQYGIKNGIRQFLDLGSGLPTVGNVHEIAQAQVPDARVVYVDNELIAVARSYTLLEHNPYAKCIEADLTEPNSVLQHEITTSLIDFSQPLMILACAVLHFVPDNQNPFGVVQAYADALPSGSYFALSHATATDYPEQLADVLEVYQRTQNSAHLRTRAEITRLLAPFEHFVNPGVVYTPEWRPEHMADVLKNPAESLAYGAVGHMP